MFAEAGQTPTTDVPDEQLERARRMHERSRQRAPAPKPVVEPKTSAVKSRGQIERKSTSKTTETSKPSRKLLPFKRNDNDASRLPIPRDRTFLDDTKDDDDAKGQLDKRMSETNRMYDRRDYEGAMAQAREILAEAPGNVRMLRVVVSSACIMGDEQVAREHYGKLPPRHQRQMDRRCSRYGMKFNDKE